MAGTPTEQYEIGLAYFMGKETKADIPRGLYWMEKAASKGHAQSTVKFNQGIYARLQG